MGKVSTGDRIFYLIIMGFVIITGVTVLTFWSDKLYDGGAYKPNNLPDDVAMSICTGDMVKRPYLFTIDSQNQPIGIEIYNITRDDLWEYILNDSNAEIEYLSHCNGYTIDIYNHETILKYKAQMANVT